jgi:hypothetical protein
MTQFAETLSLIRERLNRSLSNGHFSFSFLMDLAMHAAQDNQNVFQVIHEIHALEQNELTLSRTKSAEPFSRSILAGYWHKHYTCASYIIKNVWNEMNRNRTIEKFFNCRLGERLTEENISILTDQLINGNYLRRHDERRLTGEWIIFSKTECGNYYVSLANHNESDDAIAERLKRYENVDSRVSWDCRKTKFALSNIREIPNHEFKSA